MAPRIKETTWVEEPIDPAFDEVQPMKPVFEDSAASKIDDEEVEDDIPTVFKACTADFFSNFIGGLLCGNDLNMVEERALAKQQLVLVHEELLRYFENKEEKIRLAALQKEAEEEAKTKAAVPRQVPKESTLPRKVTKKRGFLRRLFGGCKSDEAV